MTVDIEKQNDNDRYVLMLYINDTTPFVSCVSFATKEEAIEHAESEGFTIGDKEKRNYTCEEVARYVLGKKRKSRIKRTTCFELNFILYYIQRRFLKNGTPLFNEDFRAWSAGPVIPEIYETFKHCEKEVYPKTSKTINKEFRDIIDPVIERNELLFGEFFQKERENPDSAWLRVYGKNGEGKDKIIPKSLIKIS